MDVIDQSGKQQRKRYTPVLPSHKNEAPNGTEPIAVPPGATKYTINRTGRNRNKNNRLENTMFTPQKCVNCIDSLLVFFLCRLKGRLFALGLRFV